MKHKPDEPHRWLIKGSVGTCRICGVTQLFNNEWKYNNWRTAGRYQAQRREQADRLEQAVGEAQT